MTAVSDPINRPARGRLDPVKGFTLFTEATKDAVHNCKLKAQYLSDPMPLVDMYDAIPPNPNSKHQLTEWLSQRGESKLESFHDRLAHFANCGMRETLADNFNLVGTAAWNHGIRYKKLLTGSFTSLEERKKIPAVWERVVAYWNHSEISYVDRLAAKVASATTITVVDVPVVFKTKHELHKHSSTSPFYHFSLFHVVMYSEKNLSPLSFDSGSAHGNGGEHRGYPVGSMPPYNYSVNYPNGRTYSNSFEATTACHVGRYSPVYNQSAPPSQWPDGNLWNRVTPW